MNALLENTLRPPHGDGFWRRCCVCHSFYGVDGNPLFFNPTDATIQNVSHGYCAECFRGESEKLNKILPLKQTAKKDF